MGRAFLGGAARLASTVAIFWCFHASGCGSDPDKKAGSKPYAAADGGAAGSDAVSVAGESPGNGGVGGETPVAVGGDNSAGVAGASGDTGMNHCPESTAAPVVHEGETLTEDTTWSGVHVVGNNVQVHGLLTIEPCTVVKFMPGDRLYVTQEGAVHAIGEPDRPITFTSDRRTPAAGDWSSIVVWYDASNDSTFQHVIVEYAKTGITIDAGATADLSDVVVRHSSDVAVQIGAGAVLPRFDQVSVEDAESCLEIGADEVRQIGSFSCVGAVDPTIGISSGESVTQAATWKNLGSPYKIFGVNVQFNAIVELDPGVEIQFNPGLDLFVTDGGALRALGTKDQHVIFRSSKPAPAAGDWGYLRFDGSGSANSLLRWTDVRDADEALYLFGNGKVAVENVDFSGNTCGVYINFSGGTVTEVAGSTNDLGAVCPP
jgi:hypothetical protein